MMELRERENTLPTATDNLTELKKWVAELSRKTNDEEGVRLNRAVELIARTFEVQLHEVAILGLTPDGRSLRFLAPDSLRAVGQIPLSSGSALAARTMRELAPGNREPFSRGSACFCIRRSAGRRRPAGRSDTKNHELADHAGEQGTGGSAGIPQGKEPG